jgi:hypothetical protein
MVVKARQGGTGRVRGGRPGAQQGGGSSPGSPSGDPTGWVGPKWSPTDHSEFYTISGTNNETATRNSAFGGTNTFCRSDTAQTAGARDVFILIGQMGSAGFLVGLANGAEGTYVGATNNSIGYWAQGNTFINAGFGAVSPPSYTTGDTIGIRADLDANTVAFNKNGGAWSATTSISVLRPGSDPIFIAASLTDVVNDFVTILNQ